MISTTLLLLIVPLFLLIVVVGILVSRRGDSETTSRRFPLFVLWAAAGLLAVIVLANLLISLAGAGILSYSLLYFLLPFVLVVTTGMLVRRRGNPETAGRRFLLFVVWAAAGLMAVNVLANWLIPTGGYGTVTVPSIAGLLALILLHLREFPRLGGRDRSLVLLALILFVGLAAVPISTAIRAGETLQQGTGYFVWAILAVSGLLAIAWGVGKRYPTALGLLVLGCLALFNGLELTALPVLAEPPAWQPALSVAVYTTLPALVVATVAILAASGLRLLLPAAASEPLSPGAQLWRLTLAALVLAAYLVTFAWMWLWDGTNDGLRGLAMLMVSGLAAAAAALVLALSTTGWRRWAGVVFPILVVGTMQATASNAWQGVDNPTLIVTERRAARIEQAVESYEEETGSYPDKLEALVPGKMWRVPLPMILPGDTWCYQGGEDYYRLGSIYRDHWSAPSITVRVYASAGAPPERSWSCDEKLAELQPQYDLARPGAGPTPEPLPTGPVPAERVSIQPVISAPSLAVGDWSPDGAYLIFGLTAYSDAQTEVELHFLEAATGEVCRASEPAWTAGERSDGVREHVAWLPDGRLLYVSEGGETVAMTPCAEGAEPLTDRYPVPFTGAPSFDEQSRRVLLKSEEAYWLMDGNSLEVKQIAGIRPTGLESPWAWYDWSPGGERLVISLLNDPEGDNGGTLFIVDVATAEVERTLSLEDASMANLSVAEWLAPQKLLVHGGLLEIDIGSDPPQTTDLLRDVFLLDLAYPADISSMDSLPNPAGEGYYLGIRANHPRNQSVYLYTSETGDVQVFEHDTHTLLFFPDGEWMALPQWEDEPSYRDEYELVWIERPGETGRLAVEGHTPRDHPQLFPTYLPASSQLVVGSSQGVSLVSVPDGETVAFWELSGGSGYGIRIVPAQDGTALAVVASGAGLYHISLPPSDE